MNKALLIRHLYRRGGAVVRQKDGLWDLIQSQFVPRLLAIGLTLFTAHQLGPAERGVFSFISADATVLAVFLYSNMHVGVVRATRQGDGRAFHRGLIVIASIAALVSAFAGTLLLTDFQLGLLTPEIALVIALCGSLSIISLYISRTLQGLGQARQYRNVLLLQSVLTFVFGVTAAAIFRSAIAVALGWAISIAISAFVALLSARKLDELNITGSPTPWRTLVGTSLSAYVGYTGQQLMLRADILVLGIFGGSSADLGIYSIAWPLATLCWTIAEALSLAAFALRGTSEDRQKAQQRLVRLNFLLGGAVALAVIPVAAVFIPLFLPEYSGVMPLLVILIPGAILQGYSRIELSGLIAYGSRRWPVIVGIGSALLSLIFVPLVLRHGATGAAIAATLTCALQAVMVRFVLMHVRRG